jgi:hypothetical protein
MIFPAVKYDAGASLHLSTPKFQIGIKPRQEWVVEIFLKILYFKTLFVK